VDEQSEYEERNGKYVEDGMDIKDYFISACLEDCGNYTQPLIHYINNNFDWYDVHEVVIFNIAANKNNLITRCYYEECYGMDDGEALYKEYSFDENVIARYFISDDNKVEAEFLSGFQTYKTAKQFEIALDDYIIDTFKEENEPQYI
jgi:hypothetical protein